MCPSKIVEADYDSLFPWQCNSEGKNITWRSLIAKSVISGFVIKRNAPARIFKTSSAYFIYKFDNKLTKCQWQFAAVRKRDKRIQLAFGTLLKQLREKVMWTQADLSAVVDMDENQISRLENGTNAPNLHTIVALAVALGRHPSDLLQLDYKFELNDDFDTRHKKQKGPETTSTIKRLVDGNFFSTPRSVADVILYCKREYKILLKSSATAGALKKFKDKKMLKRRASPVAGRFVYYK